MSNALKTPLIPAPVNIISMTPPEIVAELDKYIIGQQDAKRAIAIAFRSRWRRMQIKRTDPVMGDEITPKNILMVGPTGVGKTEIARRLAKLADAPFIKVEATKFTEVGYVGRDVESIIRELADIAMKSARESEMAARSSMAEEAAEERILDALLPPATKYRKTETDESDNEDEITSPPKKRKDSAARQRFRKKLRDGQLDEHEIEIEVANTSIGVEIMAPPGMEDMSNQIQHLFQNLNSDRTKKRRLTIKEAYKVLLEEEAGKLINEDELREKALEAIQERGIVFIDEMDKIAKRAENSGGGDVSREGVQRDLLPLIEGCTVTTKYGPVKTDHILFIASGAFHHVKPSDLIAELQGRLPIRVELKALTIEDFVKILTEPRACLTKQYIALMATEGFTLTFDPSAIQQISEIASHVNEAVENIGARRLHTVLERLLEDLSFSAADQSEEEKSVLIDRDYVQKKLFDLLSKQDLSRFML